MCVPSVSGKIVTMTRAQTIFLRCNIQMLVLLLLGQVLASMGLDYARGQPNLLGHHVLVAALRPITRFRALQLYFVDAVVFWDTLRKVVARVIHPAFFGCQNLMITLNKR